MIKYDYFKLDNGLEVIVHPDPSSKLVCLNLLYKVGSKNECPDKTGFAHLFEHLMFGGSKNVKAFDKHLQAVGGENNAFTSNDLTNYYITLPSANIETAFWLESDRMESLLLNPEVLETQRKVVIEEFRQRYLNVPYGDAWLFLKPLAYKTHPYQWPTIGKDISHIQKATLDDVRDFFMSFYAPNNAILVLAGDVTKAGANHLSKKWFGSIPTRKLGHRTIPKEKPQESFREMNLKRDVAFDAIFSVYHMPGKGDKGFTEVDLFSDYLGQGLSSILNQKLVREKPLFSSLSAYITGDIDPGLFIIAGRVSGDIKLEEAEKALDDLIYNTIEQPIAERELTRLKNQAESALVFGNVDLLNRAMELAFAAHIGNPDLVNTELKRIASVSSTGIMDEVRKVIRKDNCSRLRYYKKK